MFISLDLSVVYIAAAIAVAVLVVGTPLFWRLAVAMPRAGRVLLASFACLGIIGLVALPFTMRYPYGETALFALLFSSILQLIAMPILALLPRRARPAL
ncbi:MAG: hypothetical protein JWO24_2097 [Rhodospirillales bacterium]|jgi:hypothetical protein|nr:hypothetical protein [Rhodospirillales bacterium]